MLKLDPAFLLVFDVIRDRPGVEWPFGNVDQVLSWQGRGALVFSNPGGQAVEVHSAEYVSKGCLRSSAKACKQRLSVC